MPQLPIFRVWAVLAAVLPLLSGCATVGGGGDAAVLRAKNTVAPALVHIRPVKEVYTRGKREEVLVIGSGFIISPDGYVVTNEHVAGESKIVKCVLSDKDEVDAKVVGVDPFTDIAVLKLDVPRKLPHVRFGDSERLEAGQTVMALGSPHGLARSVSLGIVSVTDRHLENLGPREAPFNNWIQTDAAINPGNSGGPLVNLRGEVVGVNARVLSGAENVGFAIPSSIARQVVDEIIRNGRVIRSNIGIDLQGMLARTDDPSVKGVVIAGVEPLSPAAEAKVLPGDLLLAVNGVPVHARFEEDLPRVRKLIADLPVGKEAVLTVRRGETQMDIAMATEEKSAMEGEELEFEEWGFTASELTPAVVRRAQLTSREGIMVSGAQVGGIAGNAGLTAGDIVLRVDGAPVVNLAGFKEQYRAAVDAGRPRVVLFVKRNALTRFVMIKQDGPRAVNAPAEGEGESPNVE